MPDKRLKRQINDLLEGSMGLNIFPCSFRWIWRFGQPPIIRNNPYLAGLSVAALYAALFCGVPWLLFFASQSIFAKPSWPLFLLQIYGSFWSGWATTTTRITSSLISRTIEGAIIPELSPRTADVICEDLRRRFEKVWLLATSWGIAAVGATLAGYLIHHDAPEASLGEVIWWSTGWAILFATAAKVVNVARFYRVFAAHLKDDPEKLYAMDPARSTLVISVASVARRVLLFWLGIAVSIALVVPFAVRNWNGWLPSNLFTIDPSRNWFVLIDVLITGFFSIGFGTIVFLRSEAAIRLVVEDVTRATLRLIEAEVARLRNRFKELSEVDWRRLTELNLLHDKVAMAGSYRSVIISGLSVLVPFVIPVVSLFLGKGP